MSIPARRSNIHANSAGSKDQSFGNTDPKTGETFFSQITGISAVRGDGSTITAGISHIENQRYIAVFIHDAKGELDSEHSPVFIPTTDSVRLFNLIIQPDGKPLLLFSLGDAEIAMVTRFKKDGTLDTEFGVEGTRSLGIRIYAGLLPRSGLAVRCDWHILIAHRASTQDSCIHELNANGTATNFGKPGPIKLGGTSITSLIIASTGFVVGGHKEDQALLLGYDASGNPDVEFGENGEKALGQNLSVSALALGPEGSIGVVGASRFYPQEQNLITKLQPNGSFSQEFNNGLPKVTDTGTGSYTSLIFQDDGKMVALAREDARGSYVNLVRHTLDGQWDGMFGTDGVAEAYREPQGRPLTSDIDKLEWVQGSNGKLQTSGYVSGGSFIGRLLSV